MQRASPRAIFRGLPRLGLGICVALLVLEGLLRIAAAINAARLPERPAWVGRSWRILCLGDSNTYGLYVDKSKSYPRVLEALWNARNGEEDVEVLDMGFPVTNSSQLLKEIDRMVWAFRPNIVTVMIGANDYWTVPESAHESPDLRVRMVAWLWENSRAYRLFYMLGHMLRGPRVRVSTMPGDLNHATVRYGGWAFNLGGKGRPRDGADDSPRGPELARNLESLPAHVTQIGAQLVFVTYASEGGFYGAANGMIRAAAKESATPLIDVAAEFRELCPEDPCPYYFFPDGHPTAAGYERIAQLLLQRLLPMSSQARKAEP